MFDERLRVAVLAAVLSTVSLTRAAHANTNQCLLAPATVPGLSGPPEWQDFNADGFWRPELDDPRWSGAPLQYLSSLPVGGQGAWAQQVAARAVTVGKIMYVSIQAETDDNGPSSQDFVYVAFSQGELAGAYALAINLTGGGAAINPPSSPAAGVVVPADNPLPTQLAPAVVAYYHADNARTDPAHPSIEPVWGGENDGIPSWLRGARWDRPVLGSPRWAITLQIDLSATGLNFAGPTNIFFGATVHTATGDVTVGNATPKVGTDVDKLDVTPIPKRSDLWPLYDEPGTACSGGITVDPSDIGVWTGTPGVNGGGSLTNQICTGSSCTATENTFRVTVRHVPNTGGITPWDMRVRLRIADWDSQTAHQNDAPWPDISTTPKGEQISLGPVQSFTTANGWYWAPPVDEGNGTSSVSVDYKCSKGAAAFCPDLSDISALHQAVSVELSQPSGAWTITTAAAYRNIDFTTSAAGAGAGGTGGSGGAPSGGAPSGDAGTAEGGSSGESEAGDTNGGLSSVSGAPSGSSGTAGTNPAQGGTVNAAAGSSAAGTSPDKGGSCGCRLAERESSELADFAALLVLGIAVRRRRGRKAQI